MFNYFAYGPFDNYEYLESIGVIPELIGKAVLKDHELIINKSLINIIRKKGSQINGTVYKVSQVDLTKILDKKFKAPYLYKRTIFKVELDDGSLESVLSYVSRYSDV